MNFPSQIFFNDISYKAALLKKNYLWLLSIYMDEAKNFLVIAIMKRGAKQMCAPYSFLAAELNNIESEDKVFGQEFSCEESDL